MEAGTKGLCHLIAGDIAGDMPGDITLWHNQNASLSGSFGLDAMSCDRVM